MEQRNLGSLSVSAIGLGCMMIEGGYGSGLSRPEAIRLLHQAADRGVSLFDTAELYGPFTNEELLGEAFGGRSAQPCIATKFGARFQDGKPAGLDSRPEHIMVAVEASLRRLRRDRIDLLYQHRVDPQVPIEDVAGAVSRLIEAGKVGAFGLSEASAATLRRAHLVQQVTAIQSEYSLWSREPEGNGVFAACEELGIGFVAFSPLGRGYLTATVGGLDDPDDNRRNLPRFSEAAMAGNRELLALVQAFAERKTATCAQIVLAWILAQRPWIVPIPGSSRLQRIEENLAAAEIRFTPQELADFQAALSAIPVEGERYPEYLLAMTGL